MNVSGPPQPSTLKPFAPILLRTSITTVAVLVMLLAAGGWWAYGRHVEEARVTTDAVTRLLAHQTARTFEVTNLALMRLVDVAGKTDWTDPGSVRTLETEAISLKYNLPFLSRVFILGPDGRVRVSTMGSEVQSIDVSERSYFKAMREGSDGLFVSPTTEALSDGAQIIMLARRIETPNGTFGGVALISFLTDDIQEFFATLAAPYASIMVILDAGGRPILQEPPPEDGGPDELDPALRTALSIGRSENTAAGSTVGQERYWSYRRAGTFPVDVAVGASIREMRLAWLGYVMPYAAFVLSALAALAALIFVAHRHAGIEDAYRRRLAETNTELEGRVAERTADLEGANARLRGALDERGVLLREIHHRVKNNMQVIASLLSIQSNSVNPQLRPYFQDNMQRIRAMARIHESLYASDNLSRVDFAAYLGSLAEDLNNSFGASDRVTCRIDGPSMSFPIDIATPLGLLLNEVISNSLKHGFPDGRTGEISVSIAPDDDGITFIVRDDGAGLPPDLDLDTDRSMGLRLIRILAQQLGASYTFEKPDEGGTLFRLLLPRPPDI